MTEQRTIPRLGTTPETYSFDDLFIKGLEEAQALAGQHWTDYNEHDPGVTILEQFCYALTDLNYRIDFPTADFFCDNNGRLDSKKLALHSPSQVLPSSRVTHLDLQKQLLDGNAPETCNDDLANIVSVSICEERSQLGLISLLVEPEEPLKQNEESALEAKIRDHFEADHLLGEELLEVCFVPVVACGLSISLEITGSERAEKLVAELLSRADDALTQRPQFVPYELFRDQGKAGSRSLLEIFDGPLLSKGALESDQLDKSQPIDLKRLESALLEIEGLDRIVNMHLVCLRDISSVGVSFRAGDTVAFSADRSYAMRLQPELQNLDDIRLYPSRAGSLHGQQSIQFSAAEVHLRLRNNRTATRGEGQRATISDADSVTSEPQATHRNFGDYIPITEHFPPVYGLQSSSGHTEGSGPEQQLQQLRSMGYISLIDQHMANFAADLDGLSRLYAVDELSASTYQSQIIRETITAEGSTYLSAPTLQTLLSEFDNSLERKSRLLDYLLALHGEQFLDGEFLKFVCTSDSTETKARQLVERKSMFLKNVIELSSRRGCMNLDGSAIAVTRASMRLGLGAKESDHGIRMIEHLALRPRSTPDEELAVVLDGQAFFAHRLSVLVPQSTYDKQGFRHVLEDVIRAETPAHLALNFCWLDDSSAAEFQAHYQTFSEMRWARRSDQTTALNRSTQAIRQFIRSCNTAHKGSNAE